jgi:hypothetical protein
MAAFVIKLLGACPTTQAVCTLTRLSWSTVNAIMVSAVERGMLGRTEEEISYLGTDEKSSERGHTYASILTDIDRSRVLDLVPERKLVSAVSLLETLTPAQRISVTSSETTTLSRTPYMMLVYSLIVNEYAGLTSPLACPSRSMPQHRVAQVIPGKGRAGLPCAAQTFLGQTQGRCQNASLAGCSCRLIFYLIYCWAWCGLLLLLF